MTKPTTGHDTPARQAAVKAATFDELFGKPAESETFEVVLDPVASAELDEARMSLSTAETQLRLFGNAAGPTKVELEATIDDARERVKRAKDEAAKSTRVIELRAIDAMAFDKLVEKHPPNDDQRRRNLAWNQETFVPALIAVCSVEPSLSEEQVCQLRERWNRGEMQQLWETCLNLCTRHRVADLGKD